jgi:transposase
MPYRIAGVDVHKKMLAVAVADVAGEGEWRFERRQFGTSPRQLRELAEWCAARAVEEVVMESTAQYWRPVWDALEHQWQPLQRGRADAAPTSGALHLAQAQSNNGPRGRKKDFPDAERLVKRLVAHELTLSLVPDVPQRLWRTVTRRKYQLTCSAWRRCLVSVSIQRSRSSPRWVRRPPPSRLPNVWRRGSAPVRGTTKVPASITVIDHPTAIVRCAAC